MLVHTLPRELLVRVVPLENLPIHHREREHVDLVVVLGMRVPKLRRLPVHGAHQAADHRTRRLLDLRETKVCDLCDALGCDEDVRRFAIAVDDRRLPQVEILEATRDVEHDAELQMDGVSKG